MDLIWSLLSLVLSLTLTDSNLLRKRVKVPASYAGYKHDNITISCTYVSNKTEKVFWYKDFPRDSPPRKLLVSKDETGKQQVAVGNEWVFFGRARIVGQASLFIRDMRYYDEGDYRCEIGSIGGADTHLRVNYRCNGKS